MKKSKRKSKKYLETNDNENTMTQNLWDAAKEVLREKFRAIQSYLKKQETSKINNLILHLKQLEKEEQKKERKKKKKQTDQKQPKPQQKPYTKESTFKDWQCLRS